MKTNRKYLSGTYSRIILLQIVLFISTMLILGCYTDKKISTASIEMVVVFKTEVPVEKANSILFEREYIFHSGMDKNRGKKYAHETGPEFIVQVPKEKIEQFRQEMKSIPQIFEVYQAEWTANKD